MSLIEALGSFPGTPYAHPISSGPHNVTRLNPYLPLPSKSNLYTNSTFLPSLTSAPPGSVIHVLEADSIIDPRSDSAVVLISRTAQEGYDHALLGSKVAKEGGVVYHFISASALEGELVTMDDVEGWLEEPASPLLNGHHHVNGDGHVNGDSEESIPDKLLHSYEAASLSLLKHTRRAQRPFVPHNASSSKLVLNFLPTSLPSNVNSLDISLASPLPREKIRHAAKPNESVVVVEGGSGKFGVGWVSVVDALDGMEIPIQSVLIGKVSNLESELGWALASKQPITRIGKLESASIPPTSVTIPSAESSYTTLLTSAPSPLEILNDPSQLFANESTSPLYAFGKAVAIRQERERLVELAKSVLKAKGTKQEVHEAIAQWLLVRDEEKSSSAGSKVESTLSSPSSDEEKELLSLGKKGHWAKRALWIVISNSWSHDLASSGLHHTLASGLDVNLLVYETSPSPFSPLAGSQQARDRKKDLALYALNLGDVYTASVAVYADYSNVINAMREAEAYSGPGLVVAYLPWGEKEDGSSIGQGEKAGPLERLRETKRAVAGGWWPLFRFNPSKEEKKQFIIDSPIIKEKLREFMDRQSHLSQLTLATPAIEAVPKSAGEELITKRKTKAREAYDKLVNSLDGPGLLVLYASDGGNAEKVAKRFVTRAKTRGVAATIGVLDTVAAEISAFEKESNIVIITSTAGQGEAPQNGREFMKALTRLQSSPSFAETKVSVFGMGDSNYWPRKEDYVYYNKAGKDYHSKLSDLGFGELAPLGLGDDQDADGYQTGYKPWEGSIWRGLGVDSVEVAEVQEEVVANEHIKIASEYLRGTILEGLADTSTGAIGPSDAQLTKFHGTYMQDDRDIRESLKAQGLEPAYSFMIRVRLPGGVCTPDQWLAMDRISDEHGNGTFKMTTRQTFQFHGIIKRHLKPAMQSINRSLLDTIAACGDVNRNIQVSCNPLLSRTHASAYQFAKDVSEHLLPKTSAYHEIWLDKKQVAGGAQADFEPMYGPTYLPRKFKIAVAVPPDNAVDVFTNDVGFIAIVNPKTDAIEGYNVSVGGGMGVTHSNRKTYPRLGDVIGYVDTADGKNIAEAIMLFQRDNGNRTDRKNARLKYTIDRLGLDNFVGLVEERFGKKLAPARPFEFTSNVDNYGWVKGHDGHWHFTMFIENGRVEDSARHQFKSGLAEIAKYHKGDFRLTANQHLILGDVLPEDKPEMERLLKKWGLDNLDHSALRLSSSACVANSYPTCGLAFAESERYLPLLVDKVEKICEESGVRGDSIVMRMTGCANGCARPWAAELAFVGKAPGSYMVMLGGDHTGQRLNKPIISSATEPEILAWLKPLIKQWALEREEGEHFGDWSIRAGIVAPTRKGIDFWKDTEAS